jgi:molybdenum cofactor cytidylyltransferase
LDVVQLIEALRYSQNSVMAFVGAGGKTTSLFRAARELSNRAAPETPNKTVFVTTTTHLGTWQAGLADQVLRINTQSDITKFEKNLPNGISLLIGGEENNRLLGLSPKILDKIYRFSRDNQLPLLLEADGSGSCPLKAPAEHEPAIPEFSQHIVVVAGLLGLGKPLTKDWVHRPEIFSDISGLKLGDEITLEAVVNVLRSQNGGLKNIPLTARKVLLLNQADSEPVQSQGRVISEQLKSLYHSIVIAALSKENNSDRQAIYSSTENQAEIHAVVEQIAGIVLAAGGSSRFGGPKQLLMWKGQPIIRHVLFTAINAGLDPIVVVVGSSGQDIERVISDLPVRIVNNHEWMNGVSSSIRVGMTALPKELGGVVFIQADQPQISDALIKKLVEVHQVSLSSIVAPQINGKRGNPVLFDKNTFPDLFKLEGDMGGKALFSHFPVQIVILQDTKLLFDIDTPEDYQKFLKMYPVNDDKV